MIGQVHANTRPARRLLEKEGFAQHGYIDIFDGGPVLECEARNIRAVRDSQVLILAIGTPPDDASAYLIHNRQLADCRITCAPARVAAGTLVGPAQLEHIRHVAQWYVQQHIIPSAPDVSRFVVDFSR